MTPQTGKPDVPHITPDQASALARFILDNFHNPATLKQWALTGLISAAYSGVMALMVLWVDPEVFNFTPEGLKHTAKVVGLSMAGALITYLQKPIGQSKAPGDNQGKPDAAGTDQA